MTIYLDDQRVLQHGTWSTPVFADVTKLINTETPDGSHVLAVEAKNSGSAAGLLVELDFESDGRDPWAVVTDDSWQASASEIRGWRALDRKSDRWVAAEVIGAIDTDPWKMSVEQLMAAAKLKEPEATPVDQLNIAEGFQVELLYSVPKGEQGSWVSMCVDPKGRLIVCDQYGGLFRVTLPGSLGASEILIEPINVDIGEAQGLLWAFDSLYVVVNSGGTYESGVYRVLDTDGDDQLDTLQTLRSLSGSGGEHGPHAVLLTPDEQGLYIICGNKTDLTEFASSRVPQLWDEDNLLPRPYGRGS